MIEIKRDSHENLRIIRLIGDGSLASIPKIVDALNRELMAERSGSFVVDLDGVDTLDDAAIGILMGFAARVRSLGTNFYVVASLDRIVRRLSDTRFDRAVDVVSSVTALPRSAH
jgi:anti-anti-sigma factor